MVRYRSYRVSRASRRPAASPRTSSSSAGSGVEAVVVATARSAPGGSGITWSCAGAPVSVHRGEARMRLRPEDTVHRGDDLAEDVGGGSSRVDDDEAVGRGAGGGGHPPPRGGWEGGAKPPRTGGFGPPFPRDPRPPGPAGRGGGAGR